MMTDKKISSRRRFLKASLAATALVGTSAKSYANIVGANERLNMAAVGMRGRGRALVRACSKQKNVKVTTLCDVDQKVVSKASASIAELFGSPPVVYEDYRNLMEDKDVDGVLIATPEHWHAPMTIMAVQNQKHVYVEKPCSHNPHEGELLLEAKKKYPKYVIQMGNQQRSAKTSQQAVEMIREGVIGDPYLAKAFYANKRGGIGPATETPVPAGFNWELWQGPAPRESFKGIYHPYKWHWFWKYGTGEINNNGTHEIDICRWALGVDYPETVRSAGGRFHYNDSWEFYDTQLATYEYSGGKTIQWEGRSCNPLKIEGKGRGSIIYGTKGSVFLDRNSVVFYDAKGQKTKQLTEEVKSATLDTVGVGGLDVQHMRNFVDAIRISEAQHSPINEGVITNTLCHLGNYAQAVGKTLMLDSKTGRVTNNPHVMKNYWQREYEKGWEIKV